jgi:MOSC domain-containing protein YiiM
MGVPRDTGALIRISGVLLEVTKETAPCELMERAQQGLRNAMLPDWRGGVCCTVKAGGAVRIGDLVARID